MLEISQKTPGFFPLASARRMKASADSDLDNDHLAPESSLLYDFDVDGMYFPPSEESLEMGGMNAMPFSEGCSLSTVPQKTPLRFRPFGFEGTVEIVREEKPKENTPTQEETETMVLKPPTNAKEASEAQHPFLLVNEDSGVVLLSERRSHPTPSSSSQSRSFCRFSLVFKVERIEFPYRVVIQVNRNEWNDEMMDSTFSSFAERTIPPIYRAPTFLPGGYLRGPASSGIAFEKKDERKMSILTIAVFFQDQVELFKKCQKNADRLKEQFNTLLADQMLSSWADLSCSKLHCVLLKGSMEYFQKGFGSVASMLRLLKDEAMHGLDNFHEAIKSCTKMANGDILGVTILYCASNKLGCSGCLWPCTISSPLPFSYPREKKLQRVHFFSCLPFVTKNGEVIEIDAGLLAHEIGHLLGRFPDVFSVLKNDVLGCKVLKPCMDRIPLFLLCNSPSAKVKKELRCFRFENPDSFPFRLVFAEKNKSCDDEFVLPGASEVDCVVVIFSSRRVFFTAERNDHDDSWQLFRCYFDEEKLMLVEEKLGVAVLSLEVQERDLDLVGAETTNADMCGKNQLHQHQSI